MEIGINKTIVISAVNFSDGGPLTVLQDCVNTALLTLSEQWDIVALVHKQSLLPDSPRLRVFEFPSAKSSWLRRLYYEWWVFYKLSKRLKPAFWLSLHDITPIVSCEKQAVYCHNPAPFAKLSFKNAWLEPKLLMFNLFYRYLYGFRIKKNKYVVVQQEWLRECFEKMYQLSNVVVAYPQVSANSNLLATAENKNKKINTFIYPTLPRVLKNIEFICEAVKAINQNGIVNFKVLLTLDGTENRYSKWLYKKYSHLTSLSFIGYQNKQQMKELYEKADCLLFSSKIETWGLPLSEAKLYGLPIMVADLPYAHETVGKYCKVNFFNLQNINELSNLIVSAVNGDIVWYESSRASPQSLFVDSWPSLLNFLIQDIK